MDPAEQKVNTNRNGPRWSADRFKKQKPRRTNNEDFAMTTLPTNLSVDACGFSLSDKPLWGWPVV